MAKKVHDTYVLIKDDHGENILCPLNGKEDATVTDLNRSEDCFEADVAGRYAGNIKIRPS